MRKIVLILRSIILVLLFIGNKTSYCQNTIDVKDPFFDSNLNRVIYFYEDESRKLDIKEVQSIPFEYYGKDGVLNLGYSNDAVWLKLSLYNPGEEDFEKIVYIDKYLTDSVWLYYHEAGEWKSIMSGALVKNEKFSYNSKGIYFPISIPPKDTSHYYLRFVSSFAKQYAVSLIDEPQIYAGDVKESIILSFYAGAVIIITLYNMLLGFSIKDKLYFHYALANISALMAMLSIRGLLVYLIPGNYLFLGPYISATIIGFYPVCAANFNIRILQLRKYSLPGYFLMMFVIVMSVTVVVSLIFYRASGRIMNYNLINIINMISPVFALIAGILAFKNGSRYARYYLIAWTSFLASAALFALANSAIIESNLVTNNLYILGSAVEFLLMSFALADRYNTIQKERNKLEIQTDTLNKANNQKDRLFSIISHDLRSPLSSLKALTTLLDPKMLKEEELYKLRMEIIGRINNIGDVILNLLDWSKGQMSGARSLPEHFDFNLLSSEILDLYQERIEKKGIMAYNHVEPDCKVFADMNQVRIILRNLIGNSIKFSRKGDKIELTSQSGGDNKVLITVSDSGVGIKQSKIQDIFRMHSESTAGTSGEKGVGLGLALVKEYIEMNQGEIWANSEVGKGTRFYFTLPLKKESE